jgi:hypothetical protein
LLLLAACAAIWLYLVIVLTQLMGSDMVWLRRNPVKQRRLYFEDFKLRAFLKIADKSTLIEK